VESAYAAEPLAAGSGGIGYLLNDRIMEVDESVRRPPRRSRRNGVDPQVAQLLASRVRRSTS
jgi:hypothetical protein